jgi:hypothetical protein
MAIQDIGRAQGINNLMLPSEAKYNAARAQGAENENAMFAMQVADKQAAQQAEGRLNELFRQSGGDLSKMRQGVTDYRTATTLDKQMAEQGKLKGEADKASLEGKIKNLEYGSQVLLGASPDGSNWGQVRQQWIDGGLDPNALPEQYDPNRIESMKQQGLSMKDAVKAEWDAKGYALDVSKFNETMRHNNASESIGYMNARDRGDGGKPKNQIIYDAQGQGYVIDVNDPTLTPIPIQTGSGTATEGAPDGGGFKKAVNSGQPTDAERTAGYLLGQARLASKQMGEALVADPGASKKPFSESFAERLPFVNDEDINAQRSPERQRFTAAAASFAEAALRAATGAGMNIVEEEKKIAELTPRYGESEASIKDKLARQEMYLSGLEIKAGRAAPKEQPKTVVRTGTANGRKVIQYSDGSTAYGD